MTLPLYQVDAFTDKVFGGNPAAVCPLESWPSDRLMQQIAAENNLAETAFFVKKGSLFELRWFTPTTEVDLCGHATLAAAFVIFNQLGNKQEIVEFSTRSGKLTVAREGDLLVLNFPARAPKPVQAPEVLVKALGKAPLEVYLSRDYLVVFEDEETVRSLQPDMHLLQQLDALGVIATSAGKEVDFVSRFFAPKVGVPEDPVTGSAHCTLIPYWAERLNKNQLKARQISQRGGELWCEHLGDRVLIKGQAVLYLSGSINVH